MEVNKEEALRCLGIAQRHRNSQNYTSALKFARKSVTMYSTPEGEKMVQIIEEEMSSYSSSNGPPESEKSSASPNAGGSTAKASGVEEHVTSARHRHTEKKEEKKEEKRQYTAKQMEVVTRVKRCGHTAYYSILAGELSKRSPPAVSPRLMREAGSYFDGLIS